MKLPKTCPVTDDVIEAHNKLLELTHDILDESLMPDLNCVMLQASDELVSRQDELTSDLRHNFTNVLTRISPGYPLVLCSKQIAVLGAGDRDRKLLPLSRIT